MFYGFCFCNTVYIKKTLLTKYFVYFIYFYQPQNMLAIFFSASEYAYNMLRFFRNFSLNMLIVAMLIKKKGEFITEFTVKEVTVLRVATFLNEALLQIHFFAIYEIFNITSSTNVISIKNNKFRLFKFRHR